MQLLSMRARTVASCAAALCFSVVVHAQQTFTPKSVVQWGQGGERERGMLTKRGFAQLAQSQFGLSAADLNGDDRPEILVFEQGGLVQLTGGAWSIYELAGNRSSGEALAIQWEMLCKGAPSPPVR